MIEFLIGKVIRDSENTNDPTVRAKYGMVSGGVGIFCNLLLFGMKFFAGIITGAVSVTADAFNNLSDAGSSIVTLIGFKMAEKPADSEHPFGHGRIEYLSGLFVAMAIFLMGYELLKTSVNKIFHPQELEFQTISVVILVASVLMKFWMAHFNKKLGEKINSEAMKATAADSLSDCISTAAVLAGLLIFRFVHVNLDGYIGTVVAVFVLLAGFNAAKDTIQPLLGTAPDADVVGQIRNLVLEEEMILEIHDMVIHDYGPGRRMVSLHAEVAYDVDILKAHDVIDNIEQRLEQMLGYEATIHMDPVVTDDEELFLAKQMVEKLIHKEHAEWKIHDFRMVRGNTHTNLIFDLVVSSKDMLRAKEIEFDVKKKIHDWDTHYYAVIKVEQSYT